MYSGPQNLCEANNKSGSTSSSSIFPSLAPVHEHMIVGRYITKQKMEPLEVAQLLPSGGVTNLFPKVFRYQFFFFLILKLQEKGSL